MTLLKKRCEIERVGQDLLVLIGLKVLFMMTSLQHIIILGAHNLLMLMDQTFDKDDQAAKYCSFQTRYTSGEFRGVL